MERQEYSIEKKKIPTGSKASKLSVIKKSVEKEEMKPANKRKSSLKKVNPFDSD